VDAAGAGVSADQGSAKLAFDGGFSRLAGFGPARALGSDLAAAEASEWALEPDGGHAVVDRDDRRVRRAGIVG
jgi:hypothetical protein